MMDQPQASELLALISHLPDGTQKWKEILPKMAPELNRPQALARLLLKVALAYEDGRNILRVLSPIRQYMLKWHPAGNHHITNLEKYYMDFILMHCQKSWGPTFQESKNNLEPEIGNINSVMLHALRAHANPQIVQRLYDMSAFMCHAFVPGSLDLLDAILPYTADLDLPTMKPQCYQLMGDVLYMQHKPTEAIEKIKTAHADFVQIGDTSKAVQCQRSLGKMLRVQKKFEEAIEQFEAAQPVFVQLNDKKGAAQCLRSIGAILSNQGHYVEATSKLEAAHDDFVQMNDIRGAAQCSRSLGNTLLRQGKYDEAKEKLEAAHKEFIQIDDKIRIGLCLLSMGTILLNQFQYAEAKEKVEDAYEVFKQTQNKVGTAECLQTLAKILQKMGIDIQAKDCLEKAVLLYQENGDVHTRAIKDCQDALTSLLSVGSQTGGDNERKV